MRQDFAQPYHAHAASQAVARNQPSLDRLLVASAPQVLGHRLRRLALHAAPPEDARLQLLRWQRHDLECISHGVLDEERCHLFAHLSHAQRFEEEQEACLGGLARCRRRDGIDATGAQRVRLCGQRWLPRCSARENACNAGDHVPVSHNHYF